jgi:putative transposase
MSKDYPSNLTRDQYELLSDLLVEGVQWQALPGDLPPWPTVYTYLSPSGRLRQRNWRKDGTWIAIHDHLREWVRTAQDRHAQPSEAVIDSQSVKSAAFVHEAVGDDAGKKITGRKRFATVDTLGVVLRVLVTAANLPGACGWQAGAVPGEGDGNIHRQTKPDLGGWRV